MAAHMMSRGTGASASAGPRTSIHNMPDSAFKLTQNELDQITEVFKTYEVDPHQANMHPRVSLTDKHVSFLYFFIRGVVLVPLFQFKGNTDPSLHTLRIASVYLSHGEGGNRLSVWVGGGYPYFLSPVFLPSPFPFLYPPPPPTDDMWGGRKEEEEGLSAAIFPLPPPPFLRLFITAAFLSLGVGGGRDPPHLLLLLLRAARIRFSLYCPPPSHSMHLFPLFRHRTPPPPHLCNNNDEYHPNANSPVPRGGRGPKREEEREGEEAKSKNRLLCFYAVPKLISDVQTRGEAEAGGRGKEGAKKIMLMHANSELRAPPPLFPSVGRGTHPLHTGGTSPSVPPSLPAFLFFPPFSRLPPSLRKQNLKGGLAI